MAKNPSSSDPVADPSVATDSTAAPAPEEAVTTPETTETPEVPAETPTEETSKPPEQPPATPATPEAPVEEPVSPPQPPEQPAQAEAANDLTPREEAISQVPEGRGQIDGSGILQQTNQEVIDNLPKNDKGQVVIDSNGQVVGLDAANQPAPQPGSQA